ncbi:hypothetical protein [Cellulosimicrobium protaetiae]|uniref:Uncharacterized protein n=1 Tax=Cellulosimicrobium protaetiae TaxID=2587808 RepID=A0A6M5UH13_9MICO|nr:hypothetical protein [Cellulosimicrobium protaetiae]QJW37927.1 hypothetical protein FIC82_018890 [Cellulosimicrobium protaetiae]
MTLLGLAALVCTAFSFATLLLVAFFDWAWGGTTLDGVLLLVLAVGSLGLVHSVLGAVLTSAGVARWVLFGSCALGGAMSLGAVAWITVLIPVASPYWAAAVIGMLFTAAVDIVSAYVALRGDVRDHARAVRQARRSARAATRLVRSGA